jgi:hypothetical protein
MSKLDNASLFLLKMLKNLPKTLTFCLSVGQNYILCRSKLDTFCLSVGQNYILCRSKLDTFFALPVENFIKNYKKIASVGQN